MWRTPPRRRPAGPAGDETQGGRGEDPPRADERRGHDGEPTARAAADDPAAAAPLPIEDALDLHAFHPRDTAAVVEEYLWEARRRGFAEVRIIHGKGLGVQRRIVAAVLARHPAVASFRQAEGERGHYGATIVRLKAEGE